jgi:hypothetical protein
LAPKSKYSIKKEFVKALKTNITSRTLEPTSKKPKNANENDNSKEFNIIEVFDKDNKLINAATINPRDLVSIKCYVRYWRHFVSKRHGITLKLIVVKKIDLGIIIVDNYNTHRFII